MAPRTPRFSFYTIPFKGEPFETSVERLARAGFDAVEVPGDPVELPAARVVAALQAHGIQASAVCGRAYTPERDLSTADAANRRKATDYFKSACEFAGQIGAPLLVLTPTCVRRTLPEASPEQEWAWAVESLIEIADGAKGSGVKIAVEAWNRYETYLANRLEQVDKLRRDVGRDNIGIMGDLFHMNIEEPDIPGAIRAYGKHLLNIHFADSNRQAPGRGHIDLVPVMAALQACGYEHYLSAELLPPRFIFERQVPAEFYSHYPAETIAVLKRAWYAAQGNG
jgi:sugar phosphate isomerase/epimerase